MAPHWKCGSGQPVAGSNPALSATLARRRTPEPASSPPRSSLTHRRVRSLRCSIAAFASNARARRATGPRSPPSAATPCARRPTRPVRGSARIPTLASIGRLVNEIVPVPMGEFRFAADEPYAGEVGRRHRVCRPPSGGRPPVRHRLRVRQRRARRVLPGRAPCPSPQALADAGIALDDITAVVNCHLHVDHAGPERRLPGHPDLRPGGGVGGRPHDRPHDPGLDRLRRAPTTAGSTATTTCSTGIRIIATPGHTPGHQSLVVETTRWPRRPDRPGGLHAPASGPANPALGRAGRARRTRPRTTARSSGSARSIRSRSGSATTPSLVAASRRCDRPCYPSRAVLGGELAVPCSLQSAPAGPNPLSRSPFSDRRPTVRR